MRPTFQAFMRSVKSWEPPNTALSQTLLFRGESGLSTAPSLRGLLLVHPTHLSKESKGWKALTLDPTEAMCLCLSNKLH